MTEPGWYTAYKNAERVQVCFSCAHLVDGMCKKYGSVPPQEFAQTHKACESWEDENPLYKEQ